MAESKDIDVLQSPGAISYIIPLAPSDSIQFTFFQGFNRRTVGKAATVEKITRLPANVFELAVEREFAMLQRAVGASPFEITFLESDYLATRLQLVPFPCVISDETTVEIVDEILATRPDLVLHATTAEKPTSALRFSELSRRDFYDWLHRMRSFLVAQGRGELLRDLPIDKAWWTGPLQ